MKTIIVYLKNVKQYKMKATKPTLEKIASPCYMVYYPLYNPYIQNL